MATQLNKLHSPNLRTCEEEEERKLWLRESEGKKKDTVYTIPVPLGALSPQRGVQKPKGGALRNTFLRCDSYVIRYPITTFPPPLSFRCLSFPFLAVPCFSFPFECSHGTQV